MKTTRRKLRKLISESLEQRISPKSDPRLTHLAKMGWVIDDHSAKVAHITLPSDNQVIIFISSQDVNWYLGGYTGSNKASAPRYLTKWIANSATMGGHRLIYGGYMAAITELFLSLDPLAEMLQTKEGTKQAIDLAASMSSIGDELLEKVEGHLNFIFGTGI